MKLLKVKIDERIGNGEEVCYLNVDNIKMLKPGFNGKSIVVMGGGEIVLVNEGLETLRERIEESNDPGSV